MNRIQLCTTTSAASPDSALPCGTGGMPRGWNWGHSFPSTCLSHCCRSSRACSPPAVEGAGGASGAEVIITLTLVLRQLGPQLGCPVRPLHPDGPPLLGALRHIPLGVAVIVDRGFVFFVPADTGRVWIRDVRFREALEIFCCFAIRVRM